MNRDTISVIVPVYNVEAYLARCVDSILGQTYDDLEVILVDDGARDSSGRICDQYAAKDSRVKVIHKENGGLSSARNAGIEAATGEYLSFVDSDDWIEPDMYAHMLGLIRKYEAKLVCAGRYDVDGSTGEKRIGLCPQREEVIPAEELVGRIFLWDNCDSSACDKLYHRSLFGNYRYPVGVVSEDVSVMYRIILGARKAVMCDRPVYNYFHRPGSITTASISDKTFHYSRHTEKIYADIRQNHPNILPQASFLRVRSLYHLLVTLEQADGDVRRKYAQEMKFARNELAKFTGFILKSSYFGMQERITDLLLIMGIYRYLRPMFHRN